MKAVKPRWENAKKTVKDIFEQTLKKLMSSLSKKEVKESLKKNEKNFTLKLNGCMILLKDIESMVKVATTTWKNIYQLHQPSNFVVHVDDNDDEDEEEEVEIKDDEIDDFNLDDEEEEQ